LDKVQNQALRVIMGAMKSTPVLEMEKTGKTQSLIDLRDGVRPSGLMLTTVLILKNCQCRMIDGWMKSD
jgi:hypothetical protein